ncbi:site-2 protease family protein [Brachybacterium alimentarium]|uniref:site-2 protease family protein n=1 Tax=Brachybacterium alimentarium TaxID=47845 RepID=UPI003FD5468E
MKSPTLRLGSLPPIRVSPGTLVTVLVLALILYPSFSGPGDVLSVPAALLALGIALFMIVSVLVHEGAHALSARAFGATVDHIALTLWGGHTQYRGKEMSARASVAISLAGPVSNLALALVALGAESVSGPGTAAAVFWSFCARLNIALAVFNLLPGLPMDGGRAVEALLGGVLRNPLLGTRVTAWTGRALALAVVAIPLWWIVRAEGAGMFLLLTLVWAMLIAGMLWQGASSALHAATLQRRVDTLDALDLVRPLRLVTPQQTLSSLGSEAELTNVLVLEQRAIRPGVVGRAYRILPEAVAAVPSAHRERTPASAVAGPVGEVGLVDVSLRGSELVSAMLALPVPVYLAMGEPGQIRGIILSDDVNDLLRGR